MAQIIKHRRGSLESVSSATKRAGELLVVTGSAGITATNGNSILFVGIDGSTVTPANKILQGTTVPNLAGAAYDTSIDGIPYYDTSAEKLFILNKGGNVEVKATANTGGTGIVSGSAQVTSLLPTGVVSGSSQVDADSITNFDSNVLAYNNSLGVISGSAQVNADSITNFDSNVLAYNNSLGVISGSSQITISSTTGYSTFSSSLEAKDTELFGTASDHEGRIDTIESSIGGASGIGQRVTSLETFSGSQETKDSTLATYTGSVDSKFSTLATYTGSVNSDLTALHTFSASQETKDSTLASYTASVNSQLSAIESFTSSQEDLNATLATTGSNIFFGTQTITGSLYITQNLVVQGSSSLQNITASAVDIGTNIVQLNTATPSVRFGGVSVQDSGSNQGVSGSLLWDSFNNRWLYVHPQGSGEGYNSAILISGPKNTGTIGDEASITSGSIQVALGEDHIGDSIITQNVAADNINIAGGLSVTGVISGSIQGIGNVAVYSASVDGRLDTIEASLGGGGSIGTRVTALEAFTGSQETKNSTLGTYTASVDTDLVELFTTASNHESRVDSLESWSSSLDTGFVTETELTSLSSSLDSRIVSLESFEDGINTTIKTKLDVEGVISGSSQVQYSSITGVSAGIISGSSQLNNTTITGLNLTNVAATGSFSGSFIGNGALLTGIATSLVISGSTGNHIIDLKNEALHIEGTGPVTSSVIGADGFTISVSDSTTSSKGIASFDADDFSVTTGNVSIKSGGVRAVNLNADVAGTGLSLDGVDNSLEVDFGATAGTSVEGNTSLTVQGTTNEISVSGGSITLGNGGTVTIGLPDSVTMSTASVDGNLSVGGNVEITGNLYVNGTTTTIDSTTIQLGDNIIELNGNAGANGGLLVKDSTSPNTASGSLLWDSTNDYWKGGVLGSEREFARLNGTPTSGSVQVIGANGLLVDSDISDDGVNVTIGSDLIVNGLTASSFVVSNGSKKLISVTPSNAGDLIQWNGSSFVASNEIDGGTF